MKRLTVLSGKGGTGKTSMSAAFGYLSRSRAVLCDCDVDASNLALAVGASNIQSGEFPVDQLPSSMRIFVPAVENALKFVALMQSKN